MNYEKEINDLKIQLANLNDAFIKAQRNQVVPNERSGEAYNKLPQVDENTAGVEENSNGLIDVAQLSDENSSSIEDLADLSDENSTAIEDLGALVDDLEQRVAALEEKEA